MLKHIKIGFIIMMKLTYTCFNVSIIFANTFVFNIDMYECK